jgi:sulfur carrier protein ThiS
MKVKVFGLLKKYTDNKDVVEIEIDSEKRVGDIIGSLNIPEGYVYIIEKNGNLVKRDTVVNNNDQISLIPFLSGG